MPSGAEEAAAAARAQKKTKPQSTASISKLGALLNILSIVSALKKGTFNMAKYSKLIGTILGSVVGVLFSYLASRGLATCTVVDGAQTCAMWGISQAQVTGFLLMLFSTAGTWIAPPNSPLGR